MRKGSPIKTFLLTAIVVVVLLLLYFVPTFTVGDFTSNKVDMLSDIIPSADSAAVSNKSLAGDYQEQEGSRHKMKHVPDSLNYVLDFSEKGQNGLEAFYVALDSMKTLGRPVRIAYYGDSYIEGDILSCDLRERMQDNFGGSGCGWVDCGKTTNCGRPTVSQSTSGFNGFSAVEPKSFRSARQGLSQRYFTVGGSASMTLSGTKWRQHLDAWEQSAIYLKTSSPLTISATTEGGQQTFHVQASDGVQCVKADGHTSKVAWSISGASEGGCEFFGAVNEGNTGVTVDNFAMRGYSGLGFADIPEATLSQFSEVRPYDMILLQYGLNAVSASAGPKWFESYKKSMGKAIALLKRTFPNTTIVVVSVPDRGSRRNGEIVTMKNIEEMVQCQCELAKENKVVFLNLFQAMGGRNTIAKMVEWKYVGHDYTHISFNGGKYIAGKVYGALMARY